MYPETEDILGIPGIRFYKTRWPRAAIRPIRFTSKMILETKENLIWGQNRFWISGENFGI